MDIRSGAGKNRDSNLDGVGQAAVAYCRERVDSIIDKKDYKLRCSGVEAGANKLPASDSNVCRLLWNF